MLAGICSGGSSVTVGVGVDTESAKIGNSLKIHINNLSQSNKDLCSQYTATTAIYHPTDDGVVSDSIATSTESISFNKGEGNKFYEEGMRGCIKNYLYYAEGLLKNEMQAEVRLRNLDREHLPAMVDTLNNLHPEINLRIVEFDSLIKYINEDKDKCGHSRFLLNSSPAHYEFIDVFKHSDKPLRIVGIDSATGSLAATLCNELEIPYLGLGFNLAIQKSPEDCTIFALDFALKSYQLEEQFDGVIDNIIDSKFEEEKYYDSFQPSIKATYALPVDFYMHAHSRNSIRGTCLESMIMESTNMTIPEWQGKHLRKFTNSIGENRHYNFSIEERRVDFIKMAINASL